MMVRVRLSLLGSAPIGKPGTEKRRLRGRSSMCPASCALWLCWPWHMPICAWHSELDRVPCGDGTPALCSPFAVASCQVCETHSPSLDSTRARAAALLLTAVPTCSSRCLRR